ncbi:MAG: bifunctional YncE family protein/alkaline phosphatase family protein [Proteobacteria bacterium]|nr:bifunctional YncE family protein/alkaline phosphatase family protein [Pseudomonadota bacterium]
MLLPLTLLLQTRATAPVVPRRAVPDSGIIATDQRVTPAGVQSVFDGRVGGVRFGATASEIWVAVPNGAYLLDWRANRVIAHGAYDGRSGVHGIAYDATANRAYVSSVGMLPGVLATSRLPGTKVPAGARVIAQLNAFRGDVTVASAGMTSDTTPGGATARFDRDREMRMAPTVFAPDSVGDYMAGGPAVARARNSEGHRVAVVPLPANDALAIVDADSGRTIGLIPLGVLPIAAAISDDGASAWVTVFGGAKPDRRDRAATQCCDPRVEPIRVDERGIAAPGSVVRVDLVAKKVTHTLPTGLHPSGIAWDCGHDRLYVVDGNSDDVTVVDSRNDTVLGAIVIAPFRERKPGLAPTAVATSPDGSTLYVALGGLNAVAVYDVAGGTPAAARLLGLIPTGWYPSSIDVSADNSVLAVGTLLGVGSGQSTIAAPPGKSGGYVHANRGSVNVIAVPTPAQLAAYTTSVAQNNRLRLARDAANDAPARRGVAPRAVPERPGEPSRIEHVVYIIKENRTYDQVLGDIGKGASDPSLTMYGRAVTPNAHALAEQFVLLDHFFASGGNSADGHQWLTQANETEYPYWPLYYGRTYPSEGNDPLAYSAGGFLWEAAQAKGRSVAVFGEYAPAPSDSLPGVRARLLEQFRDSQPHRPAFFRDVLGRMYSTKSEIPSLDKVLVREYPGWTQEVPDVVKADVVLEYIARWEKEQQMPNLTMIVLPSDHTVGTTPGWCTPKACVADNDWALGRIVDALSHSRFWSSMAVLVVEDDAQNGVDHIDGHRTVAMVASPWARRGVIDSTFYSQPSMVKTIELMLGLPALSMFDLVATPMHASFLSADMKPDLEPFNAIQPEQDIYEKNVRLGSINGPDAAPRRRAALASSRMDFRVPDAAPSDVLNEILWHDARGWTTRYPKVRRSIFFPLSVDLADDEREERPAHSSSKRGAGYR